ncbi:MAG: deoxyribodipyrimidine photo-lyase [Caulobacteraceae bacterium]
MPSPTLLWFRRDLRLADNPALAFALKAGGPVIPVFILDDSSGRPLGGASRWWLDKSLSALAGSLAARGSRLVLRRGPALPVLMGLLQETGASAVCWNSLFDPASAEQEADIGQALTGAEATPHRFNGGYLIRPGSVKTKTGGDYAVFTPYWRAASAQVEEHGLQDAPDQLPSPPLWPGSDRREDWGLHPSAPDWSQGFAWPAGESGAHGRLADFIRTHLGAYPVSRDRPAENATSHLSAHLAFGEVSPRRVWHEVGASRVPGPAKDKFLAELGWREFNASIMATRGDLSARNFNPAFDAFPWRRSMRDLTAWRRGLTGYPMVDAGMRELWATGFMQNRVRMVAASFLTKHLLIHWSEGEAWFWDTLVDADPANNAGNWQWVAGSGADAAPYFRIFNPIAQGQRYDPAGSYVRRWIPELAALPTPFIHAPWTAPSGVLAGAGVDLGKTYPKPIVDHAEARQRALDAYAEMKRAT